MRILPAVRKHICLLLLLRNVFKKKEEEEIEEHYFKITSNIKSVSYVVNGEQLEMQFS